MRVAFIAEERSDVQKTNRSKAEKSWLVIVQSGLSWAWLQQLTHPRLSSCGKRSCSSFACHSRSKFTTQGDVFHPNLNYIVTSLAKQNWVVKDGPSLLGKDLVYWEKPGYTIVRRETLATGFFLVSSFCHLPVHSWLKWYYKWKSRCTSLEGSQFLYLACFPQGEVSVAL